MFGFSKKAQVDKSKVTAFVQWFCANEETIRNSVDNMKQDRAEMMRVLDEVESQLAKVYRDGYKGSIEFDYGGKDTDWELNLYHKNNKFLIGAAAQIAAQLNDAALPAWKVNVAR